MQIRRKIMNECKGLPKLQKALAMAVYIKYRLGRSSLMQNYTINKLHTITGISATTIRKYMTVLVKQGWVRFDGKNNQHLIISKLSSHNQERNICADRFCMKSFKETYKSLRAFLALTIQAHKDFIKRTIQIATNPQKGENFKAARKLVKRLVRQGILRSIYDAYKEFGVSYKRIAKETGNCVRTAQRIIQYAIEQKWVAKQQNMQFIYAPKIHYRQIDGYTFSTRHKLCIAYANTYTLNNDIHNDLCGGDRYGILLVGKK